MSTLAMFISLFILMIAHDLGAEPHSDAKNRMMLKDGKLIPAPTEEYETNRPNNAYFSGRKSYIPNCIEWLGVVGEVCSVSSL